MDKRKDSAMQQDPHAHQAQPQHDQEQHEQQQADPAQQWLAQPHNPAAFDAAFLEAFADSIELDEVQAKHSQLARLEPVYAEGGIEKDKRLNELAHREKQLRQRLHQGTPFEGDPIPDLPPAAPQGISPEQLTSLLQQQAQASATAVLEAVTAHGAKMPAPTQPAQAEETIEPEPPARKRASKEELRQRHALWWVEFEEAESREPHGALWRTANAIADRNKGEAGFSLPNIKKALEKMVEERRRPAPVNNVFSQTKRKR